VFTERAAENVLAARPELKSILARHATIAIVTTFLVGFGCGVAIERIRDAIVQYPSLQLL